MNSYLNLGRQGATGVATGPHFHFELKKDGKRIPLNIARKDIGQYLEVLPPGAKNWSSVYGGEKQGFALNPAGTVTSEMGPRKAPAPGASTEHGGMDISFAPGTQLRFRGQGSVATYAGRGAAGNVSSLRTGPYELGVFHLSELPSAATTRPSDAAETVGAPTDSRTDDILKAFMYGTQLQNKKEEAAAPSLQDTLKGQIVGGLLSQALNPMGFLDSYRGGNPFLSGKTAATSDYLGGLFG
jgi:hypothetical protein